MNNFFCGIITFSNVMLRDANLLWKLFGKFDYKTHVFVISSNSFKVKKNKAQDMISFRTIWIQTYVHTKLSHNYRLREDTKKYLNEKKYVPYSDCMKLKKSRPDCKTNVHCFTVKKLSIFNENFFLDFGKIYPACWWIYERKLNQLQSKKQNKIRFSYNNQSWNISSGFHFFFHLKPVF